MCVAVRGGAKQARLKQLAVAKRRIGAFDVPVDTFSALNVGQKSATRLAAMVFHLLAVLPDRHRLKLSAPSYILAPTLSAFQSPLAVRASVAAVRNHG